MACDYQAIRRDNVERYGADIGRTGPILLSDRYDDRTHFIYELLQNAEDALAKRVHSSGQRSVRFKLSERELRVSHFGKPFDEADVRGVCGIAEGTKETDITKIGCFGIGFKSVYAFTDRPEVHSGNEDFTVEKYVWPAAAPEIQRARDETVIVMPLREPADHGVIEAGLKRLGSEALLFLHEIEEIEWSVNGGDTGLYRRRSEKRDEHVRRVTVSDQTAEQQNTESWLTFSRPMHDPDGKQVGQVEVAFRLNENEQVVPVSRSPLFVFFPTVVETSLGFHVQGPFRTTPSRDNVPFRDDWNQRCVQELAAVLVNALMWLCKAELLEVNVFRCLPLDPEKFDEDKSMFAPLFKQTKQAIATRRLLPRSDGGHIAAEGAMLARTRETRELFDSRQLNRLFGGEFAWLSGDISQDRTPELRRYLTDQLEVNEITPGAILRKLDVAFLGDESDEWVRRLYEFLNGQPVLRDVASDLPLIRLDDGRHVQPRRNGRLQAFLPGQLKTKFPTVRATVCDSEPSQAFLRGLGLTEPDPVADVIENTLPKYRKDEREVTAEEYDADVRRILRAFKSDSRERRAALIAELRQTPFVVAVDAGDASRRFAKPEQLHLATERLKSLYSGIAGVYLVDDEYSCLRGDDVRELLESCDAVRYMRPIRDYYSIDDAARCELRKGEGHEHISVRKEHVKDWTLERLDVLLDAFPGLTIEDQKTKASQLWLELVNLRERRGESIFRAKYNWNYYGSHSAECDAAFVRKLNETEWVPDPAGNLQRPELIPFDGLDWPSNPFLQSKIRFKPPIIDELAAEAGIDPELLYLLKKHGVTKKQLLGLLPMNMETEPGGPVTAEDPDARRLVTGNASRVLSTLYEWWVTNRDGERSEYARRVHPEGFSPARLRSGDDRASWFTMFALACFQSFGRTQEEQHRDFIKRGNRDGWWRGIAESRPPGEMEPWIARLEGWSTPYRFDQDFLLWKRTFVDLYTFARWLPEYVEIFRKLPNIVRERGPISLNDVLRPSHSPVIGPLGLNAAPIGRSLGIGANWLIRELVRNGVYDPGDAITLAPYCWMPSQRVRKKLLERIGLRDLSPNANKEDSRGIHEFMVDRLDEERARFGDDFDLPLQLVTRARHVDVLRQCLEQGGVDASDLDEDDQDAEDDLAGGGPT